MNELTVATTGAVRVLTLNRPDRLNALTTGLITALIAAFDEIAADDAIRAVLLTGAGRGFCAGADLAASLGGGDADLGAIIDEYYNPLVRRMRGLNKPIVAAINGVAAGAGMNLALAADIVIAARSASFTQAFVRIGLVPDAGGTYFLPRLIGEARARALALLGDSITATQAAAFGLIWQVHDDEHLAAAAQTLAEKLAASPAQSLAAMKQLYAASADNTLDAQLDLERDCQAKLGHTADFKEGVQAFLQKRPAKFK